LAAVVEHRRFHGCWKAAKVGVKTQFKQSKKRRKGTTNNCRWKHVIKLCRALGSETEKEEPASYDPRVPVKDRGSKKLRQMSAASKV